MYKVLDGCGGRSSVFKPQLCHLLTAMSTLDLSVLTCKVGIWIFHLTLTIVSKLKQDNGGRRGSQLEECDGSCEDISYY